VIILPSENIIDLVSKDFQMTHTGLVYLPSIYLNQINSNDQLTKIQNKLKILKMISKQLAKQWFLNMHDTNCEKTFINQQQQQNKVLRESDDLSSDTSKVLKTYFESSSILSNYNQINITNDSNKFLRKDRLDRTLNSYLELNEKCFLYKGFINWMSYLAFQSVQPDLFDLVIIFTIFTLFILFIKLTRLFCF
jgi:hypothetical protein